MSKGPARKRSPRGTLAGTDRTALEPFEPFEPCRTRRKSRLCAPLGACGHLEIPSASAKQASIVRASGTARSPRSTSPVDPSAIPRLLCASADCGVSARWREIRRSPRRCAPPRAARLPRVVVRGRDRPGRARSRGGIRDCLGKSARRQESASARLRCALAELGSAATAARNAADGIRRLCLRGERDAEIVRGRRRNRESTAARCGNARPPPAACSSRAARSPGCSARRGSRRLSDERLLIGRNRLIDSPAGTLRDAEVVVGRRVVGLQMRSRAGSARPRRSVGPPPAARWRGSFR